MLAAKIKRSQHLELAENMIEMSTAHDIQLLLSDLSLKRMKTIADMELLILHQPYNAHYHGYSAELFLSLGFFRRSLVHFLIAIFLRNDTDVYRLMIGALNVCKKIADDRDALLLTSKIRTITQSRLNLSRTASIWEIALLSTMSK